MEAFSSDVRMRARARVGRHPGRRVVRAAPLLLLVLALLAPAPAGRAASPGDNGKIAFSRNQADGITFDIFAMNANGSAQTNLTHSPPFSFNQYPTWSPDGSKIAFTRYISGYRITVMNADGSGRKDLTNGSSQNLFPAWSPDGSKIAFTSLRGGGSFDIYVMKADGTVAVRLTHNGGNGPPTWSPDGTRIAFGHSGSSGTQIFVVPAAGGTPTALTHSAGQNFQPDWSPDGSKIAFVSQRDGDFDLYVINADGSGERQITNDPGQDTDPAWSPDGSKIAFRAPATAGPARST